MSTETLGVLERARARVAQRWIKGNMARIFEDGVTGYCALGAIHYDSAPTDARNQAVSALRRVLRSGREPRAHIWVSSFNDSQKTVEPVLALYDKAIDEVRRQPA